MDMARRDEERTNPWPALLLAAGFFAACAVVGPLCWLVLWIHAAATRRYELTRRCAAWVAVSAAACALIPPLFAPGPSMAASVPWGTVVVAWLSAMLGVLAAAAHIRAAAFLQIESADFRRHWRARARRAALDAWTAALAFGRSVVSWRMERNLARSGGRIARARELDRLVEGVVLEHGAALLGAERLRLVRGHAETPTRDLERALREVAEAQAAVRREHPRYPALAVEHGTLQALLQRRYADGLSDRARSRVRFWQAWIDAALARARPAREAAWREECEALARLRGVRGVRTRIH